MESGIVVDGRLGPLPELAVVMRQLERRSFFLLFQVNNKIKSSKKQKKLKKNTCS